MSIIVISAENIIFDFTNPYTFMKTKLTILACLFTITCAFAQSNTLSAMYGVGSADINIHSILGDFGYQSEGATIFGLGYTRNITKHFAVETGLTLADNKIRINSFSSGTTVTNYDNIKLVTIPLLAKLTFLKYLYADLGLNVDFQTNYTTTSLAPDQSGIGVEAGLGGKYSFGPFMLFVNPFTQYHRIIKFNSGSKQELFNGGIKFGAGYSF
jgi:hypothetical protein